MHAYKFIHASVPKYWVGMDAVESIYAKFIMTLVRIVRLYRVHKRLWTRIFSVSLFFKYQRKLKSTFGDSSTVETLTAYMCQSSDNWRAVSEASAIIMTKLRIDLAD